MIAPSAPVLSDAARSAERIYAEARSQIDVRLWRAALGSGSDPAPSAAPAVAPAGFGLAALLGLIGTETALPIARPIPPLLSPPAPQLVAPVSAPPPAAVVPAATSSSGRGLGANAALSPTIAAAAQRTGIPAAALASIIDAEAAKNKAGVWQTTSQNPRSTAAGLGQFLSGTWTSEAQRAGTWLNGAARQNGWLTANGTVRPDMRASLLALRHDAEASINATADYARHSLDALAKAGASIGTTVNDIAHAAYLGHNLGVGDAVRFLKNGLGEGHARVLLDAQVGSTGAGRRIAAAGGAAAAHRGWLLDFMARHVDASRFL